MLKSMDLSEESMIMPMCPLHNERYTNFCKASTCMNALCPQCIEQHNASHLNKQHSKSDMLSIRVLRETCQTTLRDLIMQLSRISEEQQDAIALNRNKIANAYDTNLKKLANIKQSLEKMINSSIRQIQMRLKSIMHNIHDKLSMQSKENNMIEQYKEVKEKLKTPESLVEGITQALSIKSNTILNTFEDQIQKNLQAIGQFTLPLEIDEMLEKNIKNMIERSITLGSKNQTGDITENMSEMYEGSQQEIASLSRFDEQTTIIDKGITRAISDIMKIGQPDTFLIASQKWLHYFQSKTKKLNIFNLQKPGASFITKNLDIRFNIPDRHQSISLPNGTILLFGGDVPLVPTKSQKIYRYNHDHTTLDFVGSMLEGRSSPSLCFCQGKVYIVNGLVINERITQKCESYDVVTRECQWLPPCQNPTYASSLCSFNNEKIYKFGGLNENKKRTSIIEVFDVLMEKWTKVDPMLSAGMAKLSIFSHTAAIQVSKQQIFIMGGQDEKTLTASQFIIYNAQYDKVLSINKYQIPAGLGFHSGSVCVFNHKVYALQCVTSKNSDGDARSILLFDGYKWRVI